MNRSEMINDDGEKESGQGRAELDEWYQITQNASRAVSKPITKHHSEF